jgi:hypothetical protein
MTKALFVPADPTVAARVVDITHHHDVNDLIGGWFEPVATSHIVAYVDEEGLLKNCSVNHRASTLLGRSVVGNAVVFGFDGSSEEADIPTDIAVAAVEDNRFSF